jgi:hypothetical protein
MALSGLKEIINGIPDKIKESFSVLVTRLKDVINNIGPDKRKPLFIGFGAFVVFF